MGPLKFLKAPQYFLLSFFTTIVKNSTSCLVSKDNHDFSIQHMTSCLRFSFLVGLLSIACWLFCADLWKLTCKRFLAYSGCKSFWMDSHWPLAHRRCNTMLFAFILFFYFIYLSRLSFLLTFLYYYAKVWYTYFLTRLMHFSYVASLDITFNVTNNSSSIFVL